MCTRSSISKEIGTHFSWTFRFTISCLGRIRDLAVRMSEKFFTFARRSTTRLQFEHARRTVFVYSGIPLGQADSHLLALIALSWNRKFCGGSGGNVLFLEAKLFALNASMNE